MSAGSGVAHSEYAVLPEPRHLLQIWVLPKHLIGPSQQKIRKLK